MKYYEIIELHRNLVRTNSSVLKKSFIWFYNNYIIQNLEQDKIN